MRLRPALLAAAAVILLDQLAKLFVLDVLELDWIGRIDVLPPFLVFRMAWNEGINFGLFSGDSNAWRWMLVALAFGLAAFFIIWSGLSRQNRMSRISAGVLAGGAIGNGIDRIRFGAVADFLNMSCCGIDNPFSFNLADIAVFAGVAGILVFGCTRAGNDAS